MFCCRDHVERERLPPRSYVREERTELHTGLQENRCQNRMATTSFAVLSLKKDRRNYFETTM